MGLISLSEWLDRFGDAPSTPPSTQPSSHDLDSLRFDVAEAASSSTPDDRPGFAQARWHARLRQAWQRARWRLRRVTSGQT
jgi:hypothetical protein